MGFRPPYLIFMSLTMVLHIALVEHLRAANEKLKPWLIGLVDPYETNVPMGQLAAAWVIFVALCYRLLIRRTYMKRE